MTASPAVQSNEVYLTPCTAMPSVSAVSASDKRFTLDPMDTPQSYLDSTKSAVQRLIGGIDSYLQAFRRGRSPAFVGSFTSQEERDRAFEEWRQKNDLSIARGMEAERTFLANKYAMATLSGSLLQVAAMGIKLYSRNDEVPDDWRPLIKGSVVPYCIGRKVRGVPLGLVIYAGRNQYNHIEDEDLREPNQTVFDWLATRHGYGDGIRDPAFDLHQKIPWNYPSNLTSLIGWRSYAEYEGDMRLLLGI